MDHTNEQQKMLELKRQEIAEQVRLLGLRFHEAYGLEVVCGVGWAGNPGFGMPRTQAKSLGFHGSASSAFSLRGRRRGDSMHS